MHETVKHTPEIPPLDKRCERNSGHLWESLLLFRWKNFVIELYDTNTVGAWTPLGPELSARRSPRWMGDTNLALQIWHAATLWPFLFQGGILPIRGVAIDNAATLRHALDFTLSSGVGIGMTGMPEHDQLSVLRSSLECLDAFPDNIVWLER